MRRSEPLAYRPFFAQATIFMCLILGFSVYWIRRKHYEMFLILHIALSVLMLITMVL